MVNRSPCVVGIADAAKCGQPRAATCRMLRSQLTDLGFRWRARRRNKRRALLPVGFLAAVGCGLCTGLVGSRGLRRSLRLGVSLVLLPLPFVSQPRIEAGRPGLRRSRAVLVDQPNGGDHGEQLDRAEDDLGGVGHVGPDDEADDGGAGEGATRRARSTLRTRMSPVIFKHRNVAPCNRQISTRMIPVNST